jgi:hypothetical protein
VQQTQTASRVQLLTHSFNLFFCLSILSWRPNAGGIPDVIDNGVSGFLVETGNIDAFVERLELLEQNPALRRGQMSRQGPRKNTEQWTWERLPW